MGACGVKVSLSCIYTWQLSFRGLMGPYMWDTDTHTYPLQGERELKPQETSQLNVLVVSRHALQVS